MPSLQVIQQLVKLEKKIIFEDLYLTKDEDDDENEDAPAIFTSQTFDSLKMSWRVIVQIEDVPDEAENTNVTRKHGEFEDRIRF